MEEIRQALKILHDECKNIDHCDNCKIYQILGNCSSSIFDIPEDWKVTDE